LRELLQHGELPESWIPPAIVLEWRERVRLLPAGLSPDGLLTLTRPRFPRGTPESRLLSPTARRSSSTQETQGAPRPRQPAHSQSAPTLGSVKVLRPRFAAGAPP
jgi:hypothetical protein